MELGARVRTARIAHCGMCPVRAVCVRKEVAAGHIIPGLAHDSLSQPTRWPHGTPSLRGDQQFLTMVPGLDPINTTSPQETPTTA